MEKDTPQQATASGKEGETAGKLTNLTQKPISEAEKQRARLKELFLENFEKMLCIVKATCEKTGISRETYYDWLRNDADFAKKVQAVLDNLGKIMEDRLKGHILAGDKPSLRFWMSKKCPGFNTTKIETEITPTKSWKEATEEYEDDMTKILNEAKNANNNQQPIQADEPGPGGKKPENQKQEGGNSAVQKQPGSANILAKKDEEKPVAKAEAKGAK